ncbi:MAG: transcription termination factor NusA, partial [Erysipelotrichaceae bacterium]|nr:transcription termination factor NusA [Erysipelotrichaceae bacterium]
MKYKTLLEAMGAIEDERMVDSEVIFSAFKEGIEKAFRKHVRCPEATVRIDVDDNDEIRIFQVRTVVEDVDDDEIEISLDDAKEKNPNAQLDDKIEDEVSITEFSRSEITVVKNVMLQKIKEATKQIIYDEYIDKVDDMVTGTVESVEDKYVIVNLGKTLALLLKADQIPFERYKEGQRLKVVIKSVNKDSKSAQVLVSRASAVLVKRLFEISVPEIFDGTVEIKAIAREANERTKMAVYSKNPNVDAIGSCIGPRGNRVVTVIEEISQKNNVASHENIDIVEWNPDFIEYVSNVMKPANTVAVIPQSAGSLLIVVEDKDLSVAIGKKGINARLAAKLLDKKVE